MIRAHYGLVALLLVGCGTRGKLYDAALTPLPLIATRSAVVQIVPQTQRAVVLTPGQQQPDAIPISKGARAAARIPGSDRIAILTGTLKAPRLDLLDPTSREVVTLDTPGSFDALAFSPDGRFGVLVYAPSGSSLLAAARNLNEVGLFSPAGGPVVRVQLDTESLAPLSVLFAPVEPARQLVAVTLERGVALFDALHPEVAPRRISIRPAGSDSESTVLEAVFSRTGKFLFLRASGLDDVIVVELGAESGQPVSASINFVSGGLGLTDIEVAPAGFDSSVLAVYSGSQEAYLLDARGISDNNKKLAMTAALSQVRLLTNTKVLLWDDHSKTVAAWDVADGRTGSVVLDTPFSGPTVVGALDKGLFPSSTALSVVTVSGETNRLRPQLQAIQISSGMSSSTLDDAGRRMFFAVNSANALVTMDLKTLQLAQVSLDAPVRRVLHLENGDWLVADHGGAFGDVTVVPAGSADRSAALRYSDFAFSGDLDRSGDAP